jgi:hypothetical protein
MVITGITMNWDASQRYTGLTITNDKKILGPLSEHEKVRIVAKHAISEQAPYYGDVIDTGEGIVTLKPVNNIANVNVKDLSKPS